LNSKGISRNRSSKGIARKIMSSNI
jgi:hypothetical protein